MRTLLIIILILIVLGLYFYPGLTRNAIDLIGQFISDKVSNIFN